MLLFFYLIFSTGESMGSTDTMTVSDVSTNVTLDTVSSHTCSSTSQTASCRAICGSLASFDTSSVLNTEGKLQIFFSYLYFMLLRAIFFSFALCGFGFYIQINVLHAFHI